MAKEKMQSGEAKLSVPYWDIYGSKSYTLLEKHGFSLKFEQIGMGLKLENKFNNSGTLKLKRVETKQEARLWSETFENSFGYLIHPSLFDSMPLATNCFVAYQQDDPVGTGILHTTGLVTGIHSVGIVPEHRRKGYADEIMKQLLNKAIAGGSEYATLQASSMGKGLYLKLGFESQFAIRNYALD